MNEIEKIKTLKNQGKFSDEISKELKLDKLKVDLILLDILYENNKRIKIPKEVLKTVILNRHNNISLSDSSKELGFSVSAFSLQLKKAGIKFLNIKYFDLSKLSEKDIQDIVNKFNSGITVATLVDEYGYNKDIIAKIINNNGGNTTKPSFDIHVFDKIDTEERAYWLGFLYADGNIAEKTNSISIDLQMLDILHLEKFKKFLNSNNSIRIDFKLNRCRISISNKYTKEQLIDKGCVPKKSLILKFPTLDSFDEELILKSFIRGYFDGDGSLSYSFSNDKKTKISPTCSFIGTRDFINILNDKLKEILSISGNFYHNKKHNENVCEIKYNTSSSIKLLIWLYEDSKIYLNRKFFRYKVFKENLAVYKSDLINNDRVISEKAKEYIKQIYNVNYDEEYNKFHANTEITEEIKESSAS